VGRRALFVLLVTLTLLVAGDLLLEIIRANGTTPLEYPIFALSLFLLVPIAISFWMAVIGFAIQWRGTDARDLDFDEVQGSTIEADAISTDASDAAPIDVPVAIVVPIYNEDAERVLAGIRATRQSLDATGEARAFDFFVLSDTMDPERWIEEERAIARANASSAASAPIRYRNRKSNDGKKAGNIADFCDTYGEHYRYMVVFDADSVMSGARLVRLVRQMERRLDVGIIQAPPVPVNRRTLFGRIQQFAARAYGPTWTAGLSFLQCGEGNYYGHNAIIRIRPFMEHCRLPELPGTGPFAGHLLSHDFVEAALMRRAGYKVHLAPDLGGSYEEAPPTLIDFAARDRRWCQGNLQHLRLLAMPGLHLVSRLHLAMGVMSYLASPLWLAVLVLSTTEALRGQLSEHAYFAPGGSLFPIWEVSVATRAIALFAFVLALLFVPRALALLLRLRNVRERRRFGGAAKLVESAALECLFSSLVAPTLAFTQTLFVASILAGRNSGWNAQSRGESATTLGESVKRYGAVSAIGLAWTGLVLRFDPSLALWMSPVLAGMILAVPLSVWSSRVSAGEWARRRGLLLTPEDVEPEPVLATWRAELARVRRSKAADDRSTGAAPSALERVLADPDLRASHRSLTPANETVDPLEEHVVRGLVLKCRIQGPSALSDDEQRQLLLAPWALDALLRDGADSET
jgi:membrane glycosyltransferase